MPNGLETWFAALRSRRSRSGPDENAMPQRSGAWTYAMQRGDFAAIADWYRYWFFLVGGSGLGLVAIAAAADLTTDEKWYSGIGAGLRIFALSAFFAAASAIGGWLLGLLFGIPRSLARANLPTATGTPAGGPSAPAPATSG